MPKSFKYYGSILSHLSCDIYNYVVKNNNDFLLLQPKNTIK